MRTPHHSGSRREEECRGCGVGYERCPKTAALVARLMGEGDRRCRLTWVAGLALYCLGLGGPAVAAQARGNGEMISNSTTPSIIAIGKVAPFISCSWARWEAQGIGKCKLGTLHDSRNARPKDLDIGNHMTTELCTTLPVST